MRKLFMAAILVFAVTCFAGASVVSAGDCCPSKCKVNTCTKECKPKCDPCKPKCDPCKPKCEPCKPKCEPCKPKCAPCCKPKTCTPKPCCEEPTKCCPKPIEEYPDACDRLDGELSRNTVSRGDA